ncbi:MAG: OadG family transporter subunit [Coriobacteriia bacterium]|nr:OadG family transporter subunit [Coriobacteriia bacterium]
MNMVDALLYSAMGLCVVFFALILLIAIIKIMEVVLKAADKKPAAAPIAAAGEAAGQAAPAEKKLAPGSAGDLKLYDTDPRDAAMIMAIVADELGKPVNELRFISIREVTK